MHTGECCSVDKLQRALQAAHDSGRLQLQHFGLEPARAAAVLSELPPSAAAAVLGALPRDVADAVRQAMEPAALSLCSDLLHALEAVLDPSGRMVSAVQRPGATSGSDRCVAARAAA